MSQPLPAEEPTASPGDVSVILSGRVMIPLHCDHCAQTTDVCLDTLKKQGTYVCEHCASVHTFSETELKLLRMMLAQAGYHFAL